MAQKGVNKDIILAKAIEIIERTGSPAVSMREIAQELEIRTPSLYNHVKSMNELFTEVSRYAAKELKRAQLAAIEGKDRDSALCSMAYAYRCFAKEHTGLYKVTMALPSLPGLSEESLSQIAADIAEPVLFVLSMYGLNEERTIHWQRILRSIIHGFLTQEEAGFFRHYPASVEISYQTAIRCFLSGLYAEIGGDYNAGQ